MVRSTTPPARPLTNPRACWVCRDDGPDAVSGKGPQPTGCACRGGATTHAHVGCLAKFAREKEETWHTCPTCGQQWSGPVMLALCRWRHELAAGLPEADGQRLAAAYQLSHALREAGQYEEALRQLGVVNAADLVDVEEQDLIEIGMKKV